MYVYLAVLGLVVQPSSYVTGFAFFRSEFGETGGVGGKSYCQTFWLSLPRRVARGGPLLSRATRCTQSRPRLARVTSDHRTG